MRKQDIENFARQTLIDHGMYSIPVDPVVLANKLGIRVSNAVFSDESLSGMVAKHGERNALLVNESDSPQRKRFTIAHELAHVLLHMQNGGEFIDKDIDFFRTENSGEITSANKEEVEANIFAAALLMDSEFVKRAWLDTKSIDKMAKLFKVSESAISIRLTSLGLI